MADRRTAGRWMAAVLLMSTIMPALILAQEGPTPETTPAPAPPDRAAFPDGITPSDVFARLDLVDRCLDRLIAAKNIAAPELPPPMETQLGPLHVYQMVLACSLRVQELDDQAEVMAVPTLSAKPRFYAPRDVLLVVGLMLDGVRRAAAKFDIEDLPTDEPAVTGKTPTDVFEGAVSVFLKLNALCGYDDITPSVVYAEMVRAADDVRSILKQADSESRYKINAPPRVSGLIPWDVFTKCLEIRRLLNELRTASGQPEVAVLEPPDGYAITPRDVFIQTQIILAELNLLKLHTSTVSSTPLAVPVKVTKLPSDVHEKAGLVEYLLRQVVITADNPVRASN